MTSDHAPTSGRPAEPPGLPKQACAPPGPLYTNASHAGDNVRMNA